MRSRTVTRSLLAVAALLAAALACNLRIGGDSSSNATSIPPIERPIVEIVAPAEGQRFTQGQTVSVQARARSASGVTLIELLVNGIRVTTQSPPEGARPTEYDTLLDYKADQPGIITLAVRAYSNTAVGQPVQRTITVLQQISPGPGGQGTPQTFLPPSATPYNPLCRARVNAGGLRMRSGPAQSYDVITNFDIGNEVPLLAYADMSDGRWWQVSWGGRTGWTFAAYTTQLGDCSALRPGVIPASPTPQPTTPAPPTQPGATAMPTLPDLFLSLLEGPTQVQLGADGTAQANFPIQVKNIGGQTSGTFRVAVLKPDGQVAFFDIPALAPGQVYDVAGPGGLVVTFNVPGVSRILVTVDDQNRVFEGNEGNNQAYRDVTVIPGPPTITPPPAPPTSAPPPAPTNTPEGQSSSPDIGSPLAPITAANAGQVDLIQTLSGHGGMVTGLAFNAARGVFASSSRDGTVRLWRADTGVEYATLTGHTDRVLDVAFSPDGSRVASASWDGTVRLWDTATGVEVGRVTHGAPVSFVAFSPSGGRVASGGANPQAAGGLDGLTRVWDVANGSEVWSIQTYGLVSGVGFLDGDTVVIATAGKDCALGGGDIEIYGVGDTEARLILGQDTGWITSLAVDPALGLIAGSGQETLCGGNGLVWVWHASGALLAILDYGGAADITDVAFDPTGNLLASSSADGTVRLWDVSTGLQLTILSAHDDAESVAFSPDGTLVVSGGADGNVRLWGTS